jgi:hypothetical protein
MTTIGEKADMAEYRSELPPLPARMRHLPLDSRGFPVPWFVAFFNGEPDFRAFDGDKMAKAVNRRRCWVCGEPLGTFLAFTIGPMCAVNRVSSEPPSHRECAEYSVRACPFLSRPRMRRNEKDLPAQRSVAGFAISRNPGVALIWITKSYEVFRPHMGGKGVLFNLGDPVETQWFAEGRPATCAEILASIESGLPALLKVANLQGPDAVAELRRGLTRALSLVAAEAT